MVSIVYRHIASSKDISISNPNYNAVKANGGTNGNNKRCIYKRN